jgi:hypothetical protein
LQFFCSLSGIPYPSYIFNNSGSVSDFGYMERLYGYSRISSVAAEPSMFAQSLITLLPLTIPAWIKRGCVFSVSFDRTCSVVMLAALILSTSSTAYVGIVFLFFLATMLLLRTRTIGLAKAWMCVAGATAAGGALAAIVFAVFPAGRDILYLALLEKSSSGSGLERVMTISNAWDYFVQYPWLGIGWGSATSHDVVVKLLSNVGLAGTLVFLAAMYCVMRRNWRLLEPLTHRADLSRAAWFLAFSVFLATSAIAEFPLAFGNFWIVMGMAIATGAAPQSASQRQFAEPTLNLQPSNS